MTCDAFFKKHILLDWCYIWGNKASVVKFLVVKCSNNKYTNIHHKAYRTRPLGTLILWQEDTQSPSYSLENSRIIGLYMLTLMRSNSTRWQTKHSQSTKKEFFGAKGRLKSTKANCSCRKFLEKIFDKEITEGSLFKIQSHFGKFTQFLITNENFTYTSPESIAFSHILKLFLHNDIWKKIIFHLIFQLLFL